ncbi:hypothetical protein Tco_1336769 [Tanacetum coccineum]
MLSLRERIELDLEARLMGETLVINRSLDPLNGDYIKLNDLNEPFELRRNQGDDLMPTIEEGEGIRNVSPIGVFGNEVYGGDSEGFGMNPSSDEFRLCNSDE